MIMRLPLAVLLFFCVLSPNGTEASPKAGSPPLPSPPSCEEPESRQFDFWVGEWVVSDGTTGEPVGVNHIELLYGGCVLRENWSSTSLRGCSLNSWWRGDGKWHQAWMDQSGAFRHFVGGLVAGKMILVAEQPHPLQAAKTRSIRLTFTPNEDGTLRQYSDYSDDGGATWSLRYDLLYKRIGSKP